MGDDEDSALVHWLVSRFEAAARDAFRFLTDRGFTVTSEHDLGNPPSRIAVRFEGGLSTVVETQLTTASEEVPTVSTFLRAADRDHLLGPSPAHGDKWLGRVLDQHAAEVREILGPS
jgi:hypothetical protein